MWFFDSVLEEAPKTGIVGSPAAKNDEQDGSFLIIDNNVSADSLPDTAVQLFDTTPEAVSVSEISFFSEPAMPIAESSGIVGEVAESSSSEIAFFDGPVATAEASSEMESASDSAISFMEEPILESSGENTVTTLVEEPEAGSAQNSIEEEKAQFFGITSTETVQEPVSAQEKNDIYAPLRKAIAEYDAILVGHTRIAESKDAEIADYNNQVAVAKAAAKKALEERKSLDAEMDRVKQMKELFSAQLK